MLENGVESGGERRGGGEWEVESGVEGRVLCVVFALSVSRVGMGTSLCFLFV